MRNSLWSEKESKAISFFLGPVGGDFCFSQVLLGTFFFELAAPSCCATLAFFLDCEVRLWKGVRFLSFAGSTKAGRHELHKYTHTEQDCKHTTRMQVFVLRLRQFDDCVFSDCHQALMFSISLATGRLPKQEERRTSTSESRMGTSDTWETRSSSLTSGRSSLHCAISLYRRFTMPISRSLSSTSRSQCSTETAGTSRTPTALPPAAGGVCRDGAKSEHTTGVLVVYCEQIDNLNGEWACTEGGKETGREGETKQHPV